jgi:hypothetical protein
LFLHLSILEATSQRKLVETGTVGHNRTNVADGILTPYIETMHQFLAANVDIIIDGEKDL